jgi:hypothetical protein
MNIEVPSWPEVEAAFGHAHSMIFAAADPTPDELAARAAAYRRARSLLWQRMLTMWEQGYATPFYDIGSDCWVWLYFERVIPYHVAVAKPCCICTVDGWTALCMTTFPAVASAKTIH